jgi:hypothetical protein
MKLLKETTVWDKVDYKVPNHTYMIENTKCVGYIRESDGKEFRFTKPMFFDRRGRKFQEIK